MPSNVTHFPSSKIFPLGTYDIEMNPYFDFIDAYASDCSKHPVNLYAVTLTLTPAEKYVIIDRHLSAVDYFRYKIEQLNLFSWYIFIEEHTKKGVSHLHGFCIVRNESSNFEKRCIRKYKKMDYYLTNLNLDCQNVYKLIKSKQQCSAWKKYLVKSMIPITMLNYVNVISS